MRRLTPKRAAQERRDNPLRKAFLVEFPWCMRGFGSSQDVHELVGPRSVAVSERCTWLALSRQAHTQGSDPVQYWPLARQLALKKLFDDEHYDLDRCLEIQQRRNVTEDEVLAAIPSLEAMPEVMNAVRLTVASRRQS